MKKILKRRKNPENLNFIDNENGLGATPQNQLVKSLGLEVLITPTKFLQLAFPLPTPRDSLYYILNHIKTGGGIASPSLTIKLPDDWIPRIHVWYPSNSDIPYVRNHEGRHRMTSIYKLFGDIDVKCHLFFGNQITRENLTKKVIKKLNEEILSEERDLVIGPWFKHEKTY